MTSINGVVATLASFLFLAAGAIGSPSHTFGWKGRDFLLDGKPFQIRSGEMHYSRVPREYWHDRLKKMKALGLNTVASYMFWNVHEPEPGHFHFTGNDDVAAFVKAAQEEGMYVLLRPGPYACAEWEWGGYPYWLANIPDIKVRTQDPRFIEACKRYLTQVGKELAPLQITHGGPILMVQVENEYGSFGNDKVYLGEIRDMLKGAGFDVPLYTVDGSDDPMLHGGTIDGVLACVNFGEDPADNIAKLAKYRPDQPLMNGEFYPGWFDQWGGQHYQSGPETKAKDIEWMMEHNVSFNLYMVHGGWTPGFMNGANSDSGHYHPQVSSYYDDTCIDDTGQITQKGVAFRNVIEAHLPAGESLPPLPASVGVEFRKDAQPMLEQAGLFDNLPEPIKSDMPKTFEELHQPYGFVLYRTHVNDSGRKLQLPDLQDRAIVYVDGVEVGILDRRLKQTELELHDGSQSSTLDILVENLGRINYGREIQGERKGISQALIDGTPLKGWLIYKLPMTDLSHLKFGTTKAKGPTFYRANMERQAGDQSDVLFDMRDWHKGSVWLNGRNLGRFWHIGAQQTMYAPGPWFKGGQNEVVIFDLEGMENPAIKTTGQMIWEQHGE
ncbi:MAG TPA: beta-galactosidase family protein [Fimbriimonadaceae bacterium]